LTKSTEKGDHEYQGPAESHAADSVREMTTVGADFELRPVSGADTRCPGSDRPFTDADRAPAQNTEAFSKTAGRASITATALSKTVELSSQTAAASPSPGPGPDPAEPGLAPEADPSPDELEGVPAIGSGDVQESAYADWAELVERIQSGAIDGMEELYQLFSKGVRFYLCRQLGPQELDDKVHDTFVVVVQAIRRGELRDPQRLMGFCPHDCTAASGGAHRPGGAHPARADRYGIHRQNSGSPRESRGNRDFPSTCRLDSACIEGVVGAGPRNPHALLSAGTVSRPDLFRNGADRDAVSASEIAGQGPFW